MGHPVLSKWRPCLALPTPSPCDPPSCPPVFTVRHARAAVLQAGWMQVRCGWLQVGAHATRGAARPATTRQHRRSRHLCVVEPVPRTSRACNLLELVGLDPEELLLELVAPDGEAAPSQLHRTTRHPQEHVPAQPRRAQRRRGGGGGGGSGTRQGGTRERARVCACRAWTDGERRRERVSDKKWRQEQMDLSTQCGVCVYMCT